MQIADLSALKIHYTDEGDPNGAPIVFANSLGTDLRLWDKLVPLLPAGLRIIRYDKRGHGLTQATPAPYSMGTLIRDVETLLDHLQVKDALFVGLSIGGMIGQGLAVKRPDLVRALVISNSAAKMGTAEMWNTRIANCRENGVGSIAGVTMERWFGKRFRATPELEAWQNMLSRQDLEGYTGCCAAIAGTDFYTPTSGLRLPVLGIAGTEDGSSPPDLVRETIDLVPGSKFEMIRGAGHLPCVEDPEEYARILKDFIKETGHVH
ncbi:3-oxoadipate enol-lactonase [Pseudooceanicola sp. CBS1P-1]|uniref:3-oxoadipate enol-lactonase n=1 Tax=Pseudooceanicola albus TaxID=2692189 RepID=A0A6L7GCT7_9RHOB|nr:MULTISPECIES: 3-oxoadipate enol-lactonase [Pseudooceanicola]MBT9384515.1 3-oxoadipate enol-lactonase [Pseudooceanicola endophyticus]MXN21106.1 3-oxoadipate enol-lactonase [Pseudooceanicola albus]